MNEGFNEGAKPSTQQEVLDELDERDRRGDQPNRAKRRGRRDRPNFNPRPRQPTAAVGSSMLAEAWVAAGTALGWEFPYDVNYFALALDRKIAGDPKMSKFNDDQRSRLVSKMIEVWWRDYVNGEVSAKNAKEFFLVEDWDDVRDYAHTSLRAKYLLEHGRTVPPAEYDPEEQQAYQQRLRNLWVNQRIEELDHIPPAPERSELDEQARERLRSFAERHRRSK